MRTPTLAACGLALVIAFSGLLLWPPFEPPAAVRAEVGPSPDAPPRIASPTLPDAGFTENVGQVRNEAVRFYGSAGGLQVGFAESSVLVLQRETTFRPSARPDRFGGRDAGPAPAGTPIRGVLLEVTFEGANAVAPVGRTELPQRSHYFLGNDPAGWRTEVRTFREVVYPNLYEGIDLVYRLAPSGPKYDLLVRPWADLARVRLRYEGGDGTRVDGGELVVRTRLGDLREGSPVADQEGIPTACAFVLHGATAGFSCERDPSRAIVIDPPVYGTYLGGGLEDVGASVAVDASGSAYVVGYTSSPDFPSTPGAFDAVPAGSDAFVAKLSADGSALVYSTFLGGVSLEMGLSVAVDPVGDAYVGGITNSSDFPTTPGAYDISYNGGFDTFLLKLNATGSALVYSTFIGGSYSHDYGQSIALDASGNAYVTGCTDAVDFPVTPGALDTSYNGGFDDVFVAKLTATGGALAYATYLGGAMHDYAYSIAVDPTGIAYVTGYTNSEDFPVTPGAFQGAFNGGDWDVFVAAIGTTGAALVYSTFLGGWSEERGLSIDVDATGHAYVAGQTYSPDFPRTLSSPSGGGDVFVSKLDPAGSALVYGTLVGGPAGDEWGEGIDVDAAGHAFVTGYTYSSDFFMSSPAYDTTYNGARDAFVLKLEPLVGGLECSSFLGGNSMDDGTSIAVDAGGYAYVTGFTLSTDFPVTDRSYDRTYDAMGDAFVVKQNFCGQYVNQAPELAWVGVAPYASSGVNPGVGTLATTFAYRVLYRDPDGDPPVGPVLHIEAPLGVPAAGCPCATSLDSWAGATGDYAAGAVYGYATALSRRSDYVYHFTATDGANNATGLPTAPTDAPDVLNRAPTASAGPDQTATAGTRVTLNGSGSDPDGDPLTYTWAQTSGPVVGLSDPHGPDAAFTAATAGTYVLRLTASDGQGGTATDDVTITIEPAGGGQGPDNVAIFAIFGAAVVLFLLFAIFAWRRRRKRAEETPESRGRSPESG